MEYDTKNKIYNLGKNHGKFLLYQESEIREVVAGNLGFAPCWDSLGGR